MTPQPCSLRDLAALCIGLAREAAAFIRRRHASSGSLDVVDKGGNDPQTALDRGAEAIIVNGLRARYPALAIVGEETGAVAFAHIDAAAAAEASMVDLTAGWPEDQTVESDRLCVYVDPLDGTREMLKGNLDSVTVLIGVCVDNRPRLGVIAAPFTDDDKGGVVFGALGVGAFRVASDGTLSALLSQSPAPAHASGLPTSVVVSNSRSETGPVNDCVARMRAAVPSLQVKRVGGCGRKLMVVATRAADLYVFPCAGTCLWDSCAGEAILRAAGGLVLDRRGREIDYARASDAGFENRDGIVASHDARMVRWVLDGGFVAGL